MASDRTKTTQPKPVKCTKCGEWMYWQAPIESIAFYYWNEKTGEWEDGDDNNEVGHELMEKEVYQLVCYECEDTVEIEQSMKL